LEYTERQKKIIDIVKKRGPITGDEIGKILELTRGALRTDFSILTKNNVLSSKPRKGYTYLGQGNVSGNKLGDKKVKNYMGMAQILSEETTVYEAVIALFLKDTGGLFVTKDGYLSGVISRKDLLKHVMGGKENSKSPIGIIMSRMPNIIMCLPNDSIHSVAEKMVEHEIDSLPVVEEKIEDKKVKYKIIGKISKTTITKIFVEEFKK
jgi:CBS domain-containing protein